MPGRVKTFVSCLAVVFSVASASHALATFPSADRAAWAPAPAAVPESRRPLAAPRGSGPKSRVDDRTQELAKPPVFTATDERNFSVSTSILMTRDSVVVARKLAALYYKLTGRKLHFTSGFRTPERQATAMYDMLERYGTKHYKKVYRRRRRPAGQILVAYLKSKSDRARAIGAMTLTIKSQIRVGVYISNHMRERAFDVRASAAPGALGTAVAKLGGRVGFEMNHYHVEL